MEQPLPEMPVVPAGACVVVVGGANSDVVGIPAGPLLMRDSNPGRVTTSAGGVGRNIAENLARLGVDARLVTAFGGDEAGRELAAGCERAGVRVGSSLVCDDLPGARYLAIVDGSRDMVVAINDMRVLDRITPEVLAAPVRAAVLAQADLVVADANLPADALAWLASSVIVPLVLDPVSAAKASRVTGILRDLAAITPNTLEAGALLGRRVEGSDDAVRAAVELVRRGVGAAFVTCGADGTAWADASGSGWVAAPAVTVRNASGAGDAFCAGVAYGVLARASAHTAALIGSAMAAMALADEGTVSRSVTRDALASAMRAHQTLSPPGGPPADR